MKRHSLYFVASLLFITSLVKAQNALVKPQIKSLPDIDVYDIHGKHTTLGQLGKNKVLFIDSWFIPCPPCFVEMGMLHKLYTKYHANKNVCFITISRTDSGVVKKFIAQDKSLSNYVKSYQFLSNRSDFKLPVYFMPGCNGKVAYGTKVQHATEPDDKSKCPDAQLNFSAYPTVIIFNKKGQIAFQKTGFDGNETANSAEIEKAIKSALAE